MLLNLPQGKSGVPVPVRSCTCERYTLSQIGVLVRIVFFFVMSIIMYLAGNERGECGQRGNCLVALAGGGNQSLLTVPEGEAWGKDSPSSL